MWSRPAPQSRISRWKSVPSATLSSQVSRSLLTAADVLTSSTRSSVLRSKDILESHRTPFCTGRRPVLSLKEPKRSPKSKELKSLFSISKYADRAADFAYFKTIFRRRTWCTSRKINEEIRKRYRQDACWEMLNRPWEPNKSFGTVKPQGCLWTTESS